LIDIESLLIPAIAESFSIVEMAREILAFIEDGEVVQPQVENQK
jgi:hypothetical protein